MHGGEPGGAGGGVYFLGSVGIGFLVTRAQSSENFLCQRPTSGRQGQ